MNTEDQDLELLKKSVEFLGEHFDTVQIFCSRHEPEEADGTIAVKDGCGNWFARRGQVRDWLMREDRTVPQIVIEG